MVRFDSITREFRESRPLNELVNVYCAVDEHTFLTKGGQLLTVLRLGGVDHECLDHPQLDNVARRFEAALRSLPGSFRLYQLMLKRDHAPLPHQEYQDPTIRRVIRNRVEYLASKAGALYSLDLFLVVVHEANLGKAALPERLRHTVRNPAEAVSSWFSQGRTLAVMEEELARAAETLSNKVESVLIQLRDAVGLEWLDKRQAFQQLICRLLNYAPHKADFANLHADDEIDYQAGNSALECYRDHLKLDDYFVQVLTMKEPPAQTHANLLRGLQELPSNFIAVLEWKREDNFDMRKAIQSRRRHHHNSKSSLTNYMNVSDQPTNPQEMLIDDAAVAHVADLGQSLRDMEILGHYFGQFSLTVILYDLDRAQLQRSSAECFKIFSTHDALLVEERYNLLNAWLAAVPGNDIYNLRRLWLANTNYADLSFLFAHNTGEAWNRHLDREYLAILETNHGTPYFFNLHYSDIAHTLILGATGSGKSFFLNFLLTHLQKYQPFTYIFDLGGSYEATTQLFGGSYVKVGIEKRNFTINPFSLEPTQENLHFLFSFVKVLIESNGYQMDNLGERDLFEAVGNLYEAPTEIRRLRSLMGMIRKPLAEQLHKWTADGQYGALFDNAEDNLTFARFQTFDFEGMDKYPQVLEPLLFYILHRANASIHDATEATTSKWFVMDEAWRFFRNPTIRMYIVEALKTWRKRNAAMILATQSGEDLHESELLPIIVETCPSKLFLANPGMDRDWYRQTFHLNETEADLVARLIPKQQILVKRPDFSKVLNLSVDPQGYWIYTNSPYDNQRKREAFARYGFERGLEVLANERSNT
jgi:type IV secretion system protein VirB4